MLLQKSITYTQALCLNKIYSKNVFFYLKCNELEHWFYEWGYKEKVVRQKLLKAQKIPRNELLDKEYNNQGENKLTFNITYYPVSKKNKTILEESRILLAPDKEHQKVFPNVPIAGFFNGTN